MFSRRKTRRALIQALYADSCVPFLDVVTFRQTYQDENFSFYDTEGNFVLDEEYFRFLRENIHSHSAELLAIIEAIAPKFEIQKMPKMHILILMCALAEILFWEKDKIDYRISLNEAIELAKYFADPSSAKFVSGALSEYVNNREKYAQLSPSSYRLFL